MRAEDANVFVHPAGRRSAVGTPLTRRRTLSLDVRLAIEVLTLAGGRAELVAQRQQPWASVTFSGSRHELTLAFAGAEAIAVGEALIVALPEHEFRIPGQLVADAAIRAVEHVTLPEPRMTVDIELLLLEEA